MAESLNNLALLYRTQGDLAKAEQLYKRSLAIKRIGNKLLPDEIRIRKLALLEAVVSFHR